MAIRGVSGKILVEKDCCCNDQWVTILIIYYEAPLGAFICRTSRLLACICAAIKLHSPRFLVWILGWDLSKCGSLSCDVVGGQDEAEVSLAAIITQATSLFHSIAAHRAHRAADLPDSISGQTVQYANHYNIPQINSHFFWPKSSAHAHIYFTMFIKME
jgi:hypothetical protein